MPIIALLPEIVAAVAAGAAAAKQLMDAFEE